MMRFKDTRKKLLVFLLLALFLFPSKEDKIIKELPPKYQKWLELVWWVITPKEKEVFLKLKNNRERDIFIKAFWRVRDPNPATPENEFKEELIKRFNYANKYLGIDSPKPGWKTDRGRIYILLGKPVSIERYYMSQVLVPTEVWYYYGQGKPGLPPHFAIVFFKRNGMGEFKLYDPLSDGPYALLLKTTNTMDLNPTDYEQLYEYLKEHAPAIADVALSLIPGTIPYNYQPSPQAASIIANVLSLPEKEFDTSYAEDFLKYKGIVDIDYSLNYMRADFLVYVLKDLNLGVNFLHYSIQPSSVTFQKEGSKYLAAFEVDVIIKESEEKVLAQFKNHYTLEVNRNQLGAVKGGGLALQGEVPVAEGNHEVVILLKNTVSKEFSYWDRKVEVPSPRGFYISKPIVSYKTSPFKLYVLKPFTLANVYFYLDAKKAFTPKDKINYAVQVWGLPKEVWEKEKLEVILRSEEEDRVLKSLKLSSMPYRRDFLISGVIEERLPSDEYVLFAKIGNLKSPEAEFMVSPISSIARPSVVTKNLPLERKFVVYYALGSQYARLGAYEKAIEFLGKALKEKPDLKEAAVQLAQAYLVERMPQKALAALSGFEEKGEPEILFYKGKAYELMGDCERAISYYKRSVLIYDSDIRVLNSLGICYLKLGKKGEAKKALEASLKINPNQPSVKEIYQKIK